jgi:hypothetical protein
MTSERKPTAFGDLRGWMRALAAAGELHEVDAEAGVITAQYSVTPVRQIRHATT